jgi:hypothetical protein
MRRSLTIAVLLIFVSSSLNSCAYPSKAKKEEYGTLITAVNFACEKVIGKYGDEIPDDFSANTFMIIIKDRIPKDHYEELSKYNLDIEPRGSYYLMLISDPQNRSSIFNYKCPPDEESLIENKTGQ